MPNEQEGRDRGIREVRHGPCNVRWSVSAPNKAKASSSEDPGKICRRESMGA